MKKILLIGLCCLCLCGCENRKEKEEEGKITNKYTSCSISSTNKLIIWEFYYDDNYNIIEDFSLLSNTYDSLSDAIEKESIQKEKCNNVIDGVECSVHRSNTTVDIGYKNLKPNYNYYDKIAELEANNWNCKELQNNN